MELITDRAPARNTHSPSPTVSADIHGREWWARQSVIDRTDWQSIGEAAAALLASVGLRLVPIDDWIRRIFAGCVTRPIGGGNARIRLAGPLSRASLGGPRKGRRGRRPAAASTVSRRARLSKHF